MSHFFVDYVIRKRIRKRPPFVSATSVKHLVLKAYLNGVKVLVDVFIASGHEDAITEVFEGG